MLTNIINKFILSNMLYVLPLLLLFIVLPCKSA